MGPEKENKILDREVDEAEEESFPASDPPSYTLGMDPDELRAESDPDNC